MEETLFTAMEFLPLGKTETRYGDVWMAINIPTIRHVIVKERCLKLLVSLLQKAHMYYAYQSLQAFGMGRLVWGGEREEVACKQALRSALAAEREKEGKLATTSLEFEFLLQFACGFPSTELSDFRQSERCGNKLTNVNKHWKTHGKGNEIITTAISTNQHTASTFLMQTLKNSRDFIASSPSFSRPTAESPGELASRLGKKGKSAFPPMLQPCYWFTCSVLGMVEWGVPEPTTSYFLS